jgi:hypothetical protein
MKVSIMRRIIIIAILAVSVLALIPAPGSVTAAANTDETLQTGDTFNVTMTSSFGLPVVWSLSRNGSDATVGEFIEGTLTDEGGMIRFKQNGEYTLTATITDFTGREFTKSSSVTVYTAFDVESSVTLPDYLHTDTVHVIDTGITSADGLTAVWSLKRDGSEVSIASYIDGTLGLEGGSIRFKEDGFYNLSVIFTDNTGRTFESSDTVLVYPVLEIDFDLPNTLHTDDTHNVVVSVTVVN